MNATQTAQARIASIEASLKIIQERLTADKEKVDSINWPSVGDLGAVDTILKDLVDFYHPTRKAFSLAELEQRVSAEGWSLYEVMGYLGRGHPEDVSVEFIQCAFMFDADLAQEVYDYWTKNPNKATDIFEHWVETECAA